nr:transposase [Deltaproteobacteria bacterium]
MPPRLHGMIAGRCVALGCVAVAIGGVEEHVHALVGLKTDVDVARLTRELKAGSSAFTLHGEIGVGALRVAGGMARLPAARH